MDSVTFLTPDDRGGPAGWRRTAAGAMLSTQRDGCDRLPIVHSVTARLGPGTRAWRYGYYASVR